MENTIVLTRSTDVMSVAFIGYNTVSVEFYSVKPNCNKTQSSLPSSTCILESVDIATPL